MHAIIIGVTNFCTFDWCITNDLALHHTSLTFSFSFMKVFLLSSLLFITILDASTPKGPSLTPKPSLRRLRALTSFLGRRSDPTPSSSSSTLSTTSLLSPIPAPTTSSSPFSSTEKSQTVNPLLASCSDRRATFSDVFTGSTFASTSVEDLLRCAQLAHDNHNRYLAVDIVHQYAKQNVLGNITSSTGSTINLAQEVVNYGAKKADVGLLRRLFMHDERGRVMLNNIPELAKNAFKHTTNEYTRSYLVSLYKP